MSPRGGEILEWILRLAQTRSVHQSDLPAIAAVIDVQVCLNQITGRPGDRRDDDAFVANHRVKEGRLAGIGWAGEDHQRSIPLGGTGVSGPARD